MKRLISLMLTLALMLGALCAAESFASDYAAMNKAAESALVLTLYDENDEEIGKLSGFMAFDDSHAVTTWLAIAMGAKLKVESDDGRELGNVKVLGCDSDCNLAILEFETPTGLEPLPLSEDGSVRRGAVCVSIGVQNDYNAISAGNISSYFTEMGYDLIQFTASIGDGSSGGALLDEYGRVAGVTMIGISGQIGYNVIQNMNFALGMRHVHELWELCKDDEAVEIENWAITDINPDSSAPISSNKVTFVNNMGYSIVSMHLYRWNENNRGTRPISKEYTWIKKDESAEIEVYEDELSDSDLKIIISMTVNVGGKYTQVSKNDIPASDLLGKTVILTYNASSNVLSFETEGADDAAEGQRHIKEARNEEAGFEIPEVIERDRDIAPNTCVIYNDTEKVINEITISRTDVYIVLYKGKVQPGETVTVELPNDFVNNNGKYRWKLSVKHEAVYNAPPQINTSDAAEICGQLIMLKYDKRMDTYYLEVQ